MNKKIILLFMFYIGCLFGNTKEEPCPTTGDPFVGNPFRFPKSIFINPQLSDSFVNPKSNLNTLQELKEVFLMPSSNLNEKNLSDSFIDPFSQFIDQQYAELNNLNMLSASILECGDDYSFWLGIHCDNINSIAGFQFELPNNLELLDVVGMRSEDSNFQLHNNDNGLILGFSMSGDAIPALSYTSKQDDSLIVKIHVKADPKSIFSFPVKTILAGPKGEKLSFQNLKDILMLKNQSLIISFVE